jgi:hypothetical protein
LQKWTFALASARQKRAREREEIGAQSERAECKRKGSANPRFFLPLQQHTGNPVQEPKAIDSVEK